MKTIASLLLVFSFAAHALPTERVLIQRTDFVRELNDKGEPVVSGFPDRIIPGSKAVAEFLLKGGTDFLAICDVELFRTSLAEETLVTIFSIANCTPYKWP
jgi:hypothetical protein